MMTSEVEQAVEKQPLDRLGSTGPSGSPPAANPYGNKQLLIVQVLFAAKASPGPGDHWDHWGIPFTTNRLRSSQDWDQAGT